MANVEGTTVMRPRLLHVTRDPASTDRLRRGLAGEDHEFEIAAVTDAQALELEVAHQSFQLILADLPPAWPTATDDLAALQRTHPQWPVLFRGVDANAASDSAAAQPATQVTEAVRQALQQAPARPQSLEDRRRLLGRLVRQQQLVLTLSRRNSEDLEDYLREVTRQASHTLGVARVSVWEFDPGRTRLRCLDMYVFASDSHQSGSLVSGHPRYRRALETALQIAATDAWTDPRTSEFYNDYLRPLNIRAMLDAPIRVDGQVVGVLCCEHTGTQRVWTLLDQCLAAGLANLVSRAMAERDWRRAHDTAMRQDRLAAIGRLAATFAHDFDQHLTALGRLTDELAARPQAANDILGGLRAELQRARGKVDQLLAVDAISAPSPAIVQLLDLPLALRSLLPELRTTLGTRIRLDAHVPQARLLVRLAHEELRQILLNLASNAADAMPDGGTVQLVLGFVESVGGGPGVARIVFADSGPGLPEMVQRRLFEPFVTTKAAGQGRGLGLARIQAAAHRAGGAVHVESSLQGTEFTIELPLH
jgi:signal transduction histidine kinase